jgi:hypothetical protein
MRAGGFYIRVAFGYRPAGFSHRTRKASQGHTDGDPLAGPPDLRCNANRFAYGRQVSCSVQENKLRFKPVRGKKATFSALEKG